MQWFQRQIEIAPHTAGMFLITREITDAIPELRKIKAGLLHIFIQHTSASLTLNENADADVRHDLHRAMDSIAREDFPYTHTAEGSDDMPAHVKCSLLGASLSLPVRDGALALGTWQGIYLCEHRRGEHRRKILLTLMGSANTESGD